MRVMTLPDDQDPDDFIRAQPEAWPERIAQALPIVEFVVRTLTRDVDLSDAKAKSAVAEQVVPLIREIANPVEQDHNWQLLARVLQTDERSLRRVAPTETRRRTRVASRPRSVVPDGLDTDIRQANLLRECVRRPTIVVPLNVQLRSHKQAAVGRDDFARPEDQALWQAVHDGVAAGRVVETADLWDILDPMLVDRAKALLALDLDDADSADRLAVKLALSVVEWRATALKARCTSIKSLLKEARAEGEPAQLSLYQDALLNATLLLRENHQAKRDLSASGSMLAG
jgi:DNA primase